MFFVPVVGYYQALSLTSHGVTNGGGTNVASVSFSGVSIGAAAADRLVVVAASVEMTSGGSSINFNSCTFNGVAGTIVQNPVETHSITMLAYALVPTGTTATIVTGVDGAASNYSIQVWSLTGASPSASNSAVSGASSNTLTASVGVSSGGVLVGIANSIDSTDRTFSPFTTKYADMSNDRANAFDALSSFGTAVSEQVTFTASTTRGSLCVLSFSPIANLWTSFTEYPLAADPPNDWTERSGAHSWVITTDGASISGKSMVVSAIAGDVKALTWNRVVGATADFEVLTLIKRDAGFSGTNNMAGVVRCANDGESGVNFGFKNATTIEIAEFDAGTYVAGTTAAFASDTTTRYWLRWQRSGNTHNGRIWADGSAEPGTWNVTRSTSRAGSNVGLMIVQQDGYRVDWYSAGVGTGAVAPSP